MPSRLNGTLAVNRAVRPADVAVLGLTVPAESAVKRMSSLATDLAVCVEMFSSLLLLSRFSSNLCFDVWAQVQRGERCDSR